MRSFFVFYSFELPNLVYTLIMFYNITMDILGFRGEFSASPFTEAQQAQIEAISHQPIAADTEKVSLIIGQGALEAAVPHAVFTGEKNVAEFELTSDFIPQNASLLITGKGWDPAIKKRLAASLVGGASQGSSGYASQDSLEAVTGFVSLIPLPNEHRDSVSMTREDILSNSVMSGRLIQPRACLVADQRLYCVAENSVNILGSSGDTAKIYDEAIGTGHDLSFSGDAMAIASSDTDQIIIMDRFSGEITRTISLIDHGYNLSIGFLAGTEANGLYVFPDQVQNLDNLRPEIAAISGLRVLLMDRLKAQKVPTREQTTHVNGVCFLEPNTLLATVFNSTDVDEFGRLVEAPGGKVILATFNTYSDSYGDTLRDELLSDSGPAWHIIENNSQYPLPGNAGTVHRTYYCKRDNESVVIRQVIDDNNESHTSVETVTTLVDGLRNPHSISVIKSGNEKDAALLSVANTSAGEILYYQFHKDTRQMEPVGSLNFRDLPGMPPDSSHWIHHIVEPTILPSGEAVLTVFDGSRNGVHILNLTKQQRMFIPVTQDATVYQTQLIIQEINHE